MDLQLSGKVVAITGGATGIGRAIAMEFLKEGACVAVCGRSTDKLDKFICETERFAGNVFCSRADVTDEAAMEKFADAAVQKFGRLDIWINNAGIGINKPLLDYTLDDYDAVMNVNLKAVFICSRIAARRMMPRKKGVIISASSWTSKIPHADGAIYAASKAGVSSLTKSMAANFAPYNIRVLSYLPGMIETDISKAEVDLYRDNYVRNIAMRRLGTPEDLAKPVVFLASDAAGYITGVDVEISGGKFAVQNCELGWQQIDLTN